MDRKVFKAHYLVTVLIYFVSLAKSDDKVLSFDVTKTQIIKHEHMLEQIYEKTSPIDLKFSQSPFLYTTEMSFGGNDQKAIVRLSTDTDWTMVTGAECYRCFTKAYNSSTSKTAHNGTAYKPDNPFNELKYAGSSMIDRVCMKSNNSVCVDDFEFFVIRNNTYETRDFLQRTAGVIGLAPDDSANGDSFLTALKKTNQVSKL